MGINTRFTEIVPGLQYDVVRGGAYVGTLYGKKIEAWTWWGFTTSSLEAPTRYSYALRTEAADALLRYVDTLSAAKDGSQ